MFSHPITPRFGSIDPPSKTSPSTPPVSPERQRRTPPPLQRQNATTDLFTPTTHAVEAPGAPSRPRRQRTMAGEWDLSNIRRRLFDETGLPHDTNANADSENLPPEETPPFQIRRPDEPGR